MALSLRGNRCKNEEQPGASSTLPGITRTANHTPHFLTRHSPARNASSRNRRPSPIIGPNPECSPGGARVKRLLDWGSPWNFVELSSFVMVSLSGYVGALSSNIYHDGFFLCCFVYFVITNQDHRSDLQFLKKYIVLTLDYLRGIVLTHQPGDSIFHPAWAG